MEYLDIVNRVLKLLREDVVATVADDDAVVQLVATYVNDAKTQVENGFHFNALRYDWEATVVAGADNFLLTDSGRAPIVEEVWGPNGHMLRELSDRDVRRLRRQNNVTTATEPTYYAVDGAVGGKLRIRIHPAPTAAYEVEVVGYKKQADLVNDSDVLLVPAMPVIYFAYALAARERGEVGGQTAAEIFGMANEYLKNAITQDAALNNYEQNWWVN